MFGVRGEPDKHAVAGVKGFNRFVFHFLRGSLGAELPDAELASLSLAQALRSAPSPSPVLIFDQLEDVFLHYPADWRQRRGLFVQVRDALREQPALRVLFVIREDFLARLEQFALCVPGGFDVRYRLERLRESAALDAIRGPLAAFGVPFDAAANAVLKQLVSDLRATVAPDGSALEAEFVEPLELQIVCDQLWDQIAQTRRLDPAKGQNYANVGAAVRDFYDRVIARTVAEAGVSERKLREWCERQLISDGDTRDLVFLGQDDAAGIPLRAVEKLASARLVHVEVRDDRRYCELSHDRFVPAVQQSNASWLRTWRGMVETYWLRFVAVPLALLVGFVSIDLWQQFQEGKAGLDAYRREIPAMTGRIASAKQQLEALVREQEKNARALEKREEEIQRLNAKIAAEEDETTEHAKALRAERAKLEQQQRSLTTVKTSLSVAVGQTEALSSALQRANSDFESAKRSLEKSQVSLAAQLEGCRKQVGDLSGALADQQSSLAAREKAMQEAHELERAECNALEEKLAACEARHADPGVPPP